MCTTASPGNIKRIKIRKCMRSSSIMILLGVNCLLLRDQWIMFEEIMRKETAVYFYIVNAQMPKTNTLKVKATARNKMWD